MKFSDDLSASLRLRPFLRRTPELHRPEVCPDGREDDLVEADPKVPVRIPRQGRRGEAGHRDHYAAVQRRRD